MEILNKLEEKKKNLRGITLKKPFLSEDYQAILIAFSLVGLVLVFYHFFNWEMMAVRFENYTNIQDLGGQILNPLFFFQWVFTGFLLGFFFTLFQVKPGESALKIFLSFQVLYLLASLAYVFSSQKTMSLYLEYAFWALLVGLVLGNFLPLPSFLKRVLKPEFFIKTGLVLMGAEVLFSNITSFGIYGIGISWIVVPIVLGFMWWYGTRVLKMEDPGLVVVIAVATAVCGVSAAVAAAASVKAKKNHLTFAVSLCILFTILMMVVMPLAVQVLGLSELIGGAWIGNTVDSTGAVILAGEAVGPLASQVAAMIKMIQNVLIGLISFIIAMIFAKKEGGAKKETFSDVWSRLPKFILGFLALSLLFSFLIQPLYGIENTNKLLSILGTWKGWFFCLTFLSIGLETNFKSLIQDMDSGAPINLYIVGQGFSLILSLGICWFFLSGHFLPLPQIILPGA